MDQQDLFFASYLSNQRANQIAGQMGRTQLIAAHVQQGYSLEEATRIVDRHIAAQPQGMSGLTALLLLFGIPFAIGIVLSIFGAI